MPSIADLFISVSSDVTGAISGLTQVEQKTTSATTSMAAATPVALALGAGAAAVGAAFLGAVGEAASFEAQMSGIKAVIAPDDVITYGAALEDLALTLGKDTVFSASEAANAIEELVKAGVPIETIMESGAKAATSLAAATGFDLARSAEFAGIALNTFHMDASALEGTVNTLSGVVNASAADMNGLQFAFSAVGPVAAGLGLDFDDVAVALGAFADNGLRGSDAGTSLKTMLLNLQPTTAAQVDAFEDLGAFTIDTAAGMQILTDRLLQTEAGQKALSRAHQDGVVSFDELFKAAKALDPALVSGAEKSLQFARDMGITSNAFFDAAGNARPLNEIFGLLQEGTAGMTREQKLLTLEMAFGADAVRAATIASEEGAEGFNNLAAAVGQISAADAAKTRLDNLEGSLKALGGSFETIQITIGQLFLPVLRALVGLVTDVLNAFLSLDPSIQILITTAIGIAGAIAGVSAAFVILGPLLTSAGASFALIFAAAAPITVPLLAIAAAAAVLYAAWQTNFGGIQEVTAEVITAIQPGLVNIQTFVTGFTQSLSAILGLLTSGDFQGGIFGLDEDSGFVLFLFAARDAVIQLMAVLEPLVAGALAQLPGLVRGLGDAFNFLGGVIQATSGFWNVLFQVISVNLNAIVQVIALSVDTIRAIFEGDWARVFSNMIQTVRVIGEAIIQNIAIWLQAIADLLGVGDLWANFVNGVWNLGTRVGEALGSLFAFISEAFGGIGGLVAGVIGDPFGALVSAAWAVGTRLGEAFVNFLTFIGESLSDIPTMILGLGDFFGPFINAAWEIGARIAGAFTNFLSFIGQSLSNIPALIESLGDLWGPFVNAAWQIGSRIGEAFGNFLGFIGQSLSNIPGLIEGLGDLFGPFVDAAWAIGGRIGDAIQNVIGFIGQTIGGIPGLLEGLGDIFGMIVDQALALVGRMQGALQPLVEWLSATFGNFWNWLTSGGEIAGPPPTGGGGTLPAPGGTGGVPLVYVNTMIVSSQEQAQDFLNLVAQAVLASANRVTPPVVGTNPAL